MGKFTNKHLNFEIEDADVVEEERDSQFATAKIRAFASGESLNETYCSEDALIQNAPTIYNKPVLYNINKIFDDFNTHVSSDKSLIAGFVVPDSANFVRLPDQRLSLEVLVKIWKRYAPKAMEIFKRDKGKKKVSVELDLVDSEERPDGLIDMKKFIYSGICILGDLVTEAIPGASIEIMSFSKENEEYKMAFESEFGSYDNIDFSIPEDVKKNVRKGIELHKKHNSGGTSVSLSFANFISKNDKITPGKIRHIARFFESNEFNNIVKSSENYISYMLYGGSEGMRWARDINRQLDERDKILLFNFSEDLTFPYKSLKDINPALAGIDPPISLAQANAIARQAEAIGTDKEKNGWAIAISSFKKTHVVKDGKWVKKEKTNMEEKENKKKIEEEGVFEGEEDKNKMEEGLEKESDGGGDSKNENDPEKKTGNVPEDELEKGDKGAEDNESEDKKNGGAFEVETLDAVAILAALGNDTCSYGKTVKDEFSKPVSEINFSKVCGAMFEYIKVANEELAKLKSFKDDVDKRQFEFEVASTINDIEKHSSIPQDKKDFLLEESKKFNLENVDEWKNLAKAEAFSYTIKDEGEEKTFRFANPWLTKGSKKTSIWEE